MKCRVFQNPDGTVRILRMNPRHVTGDASPFLDLETSKDTSLAGLPFVDVEEDTIPRDRTRRFAWRLRAGVVADDRAIPDRTP